MKHDVLYNYKSGCNVFCLESLVDAHKCLEVGQLAITLEVYLVIYYKC